MLRCLCRGYSTGSKANLGRITEYLLKDGIPNVLQRNYDERYIDDNVRLRLFPTLSYVPVINGKLKFNGSMNALRLIVNTFVLRESSLLHVTSIRNLPRDTENPYVLLRDTEKLMVKWHTCLPEHLLQHDTEPYKISSYDKKDHEHIVDYILQPTDHKLDVPLISQQYKNMIQKKNNNNISRVLQGVFVYEFNEDNSKVLVHTIEDIELIDYKKKVQSPTELFAC